MPLLGGSWVVLEAWLISTLRPTYTVATHEPVTLRTGQYLEAPK